MFILGITGYYCSGKSIAGKFFVDNGFIEIDVDKYGHNALIERKNEIINVFGDCIIENNEISRKKLGKLVFNNDLLLKKLEEIVHPLIINNIKDELCDLMNKNVNYVVINAAILYKMGLDKFCNSILVIISPQKIIIERGKKRDNLNEKEIKTRLKKQKIDNEKIKSAEYFIKNTDNFEKFMSDLKKILENIKRKNISGV